MKEPKKKIRVAELFAGVGGFRVGLERASSPSKGFEVVWSNQWEPATKAQHASKVYVHRFGESDHSNKDIASVSIEEVPEHDLLVGGFPCQDYSVARTLSQAEGLHGKKGVLWWQIHRILRDKEGRKPRYLMLENVDRLLKSPAKQRGRDFAIMLASLSDLGYAVEWRVINAADYGMPQRRRRVYMIAYHESAPLHKEAASAGPQRWLFEKGVIARAFPVQKTAAINAFNIYGELDEISENFESFGSHETPFSTGGFMKGREAFTFKAKPVYDGEPKRLGDIIIRDESKIPSEYFISGDKMKEWKELKGAKREQRTSKSGFVYEYSEGAVAFPDPLDRPSRTIVTGEGGSSPSRFKHVIITDSGRYRRLTPIELERLNMFPDDHTKADSISDVKRAFFMGNALVVGVIEKLGKELIKRA